jgi:hypothetical protein
MTSCSTQQQPWLETIYIPLKDIPLTHLRAALFAISYSLIIITINSFVHFYPHSLYILFIIWCMVPKSIWSENWNIGIEQFYVFIYYSYNYFLNFDRIITVNKVNGANNLLQSMHNCTSYSIKFIPLIQLYFISHFPTIFFLRFKRHLIQMVPITV